ncbi:hypothetical protein DFH06DRAFT_328490 [Mycena polygramma]|nr:hypothetical protein DFH06DRAFT_328490 [Mycena polygramma]
MSWAIFSPVLFVASALKQTRQRMAAPAIHDAIWPLNPRGKPVRFGSGAVWQGCVFLFRWFGSRGLIPSTVSCELKTRDHALILSRSIWFSDGQSMFQPSNAELGVNKI